MILVCTSCRQITNYLTFLPVNSSYASSDPCGAFMTQLPSVLSVFFRIASLFTVVDVVARLLASTSCTA